MYHGAHDIRVEQIPIPEPKPDEVQIKVAWYVLFPFPPSFPRAPRALTDFASFWAQVRHLRVSFFPLLLPV